MPRVVIDYGLDGRQPGYHFAETGGLDQPALRTIWAQAMPRGRGWAADRYLGARSLKAFRVDARRAALSQVLVTDRQDEGGRRGIRRAEIDVLPLADIPAYLKARLEAYPLEVRQAAGERLGMGRWVRVLERALPRPGSSDRAVLGHPFRDAAGWTLIEFMVLYMATRWALRAVRGWPPLVPFTTLALDVQEEGTLVAVPWDQAQALGLRGVIRVP